MACSGTKKNGLACSGPVMHGDDYCYFHNPAITPEERRSIRSKGGKGKRSCAQNPLPILELKKPKDIVLLLEDVINGVREGNLDLKTANCLGYLAGQLSKALEVSELESRMETLEKTFSQKQ